jgi:hypothetical protein
MQRQENPQTFRLTRQQIELINQESVATGLSRNRIDRLAIDAYFVDRSAA